VTAELNLESWRPCFHKNCPTWAPQIHHDGRVTTAKHVITESNAQMRKRWCHDR
jgi:hypothetical protein